METDFVPVASLLAAPARAAMVSALLDGRPRTAGELASLSRVARSTASGHLAELVAGGLLRVHACGRTRSYELADAGVAHALEALSQICRPRPVRSLRQANAMTALRAARTCYDHLAGRLGVTLTDAMVTRGWLGADSLALQPAGHRPLSSLGVDISALERARRPITRACLDWTEQAPHLAGGLGAAICALFLDNGWLTRQPSRRSLRVTPIGMDRLRADFGLTPDLPVSGTGPSELSRQYR